MKVIINFDKRWLYTFIAIGILAIIGVGVYAVNTNEGWHPASQIDFGTNVVLPKIVLDSISSGDNWNSQGAYISIGESGGLGSASMHMTYRGDGYGFIGSGAVTNGEPGASYLRFDYDSNNIYTPDDLTVGRLCLGTDCKSSWDKSSQWTSSGNNIYYSNTGNVGIGTTNPRSKLSVGGDGYWNYAIYGSSDHSMGIGVYGSGRSYGIYGFGNSYGVYGRGDGSAGILGRSDRVGVIGLGGSITGVSVKEGTGVQGKGTIYGVIGESTQEPTCGQGGCAGSYDFYAIGNGVDYGAESSIRWKTDITEIDNALDKVVDLKGVYFNWKETGAHDIGFIAEEIGEIVPEIVGYENPEEESNWYVDENGERKLYASGVDYGALTPVLVEAIKELKTENDKLKSELCSKDNSYSWC